MLMEAPIASSIYRDVVNTPFCDIRKFIYLISSTTKQSTTSLNLMTKKNKIISRQIDGS